MSIMLSSPDGACPIVGSYGGRDRGMRGDPERLERALTTLGIEHDVKVYPDAGHSFLNRNTGLMALVLGKVFGAGYHAASAEDAWRRILAFFDAQPKTTPDQGKATGGHGPDGAPSP